MRNELFTLRLSGSEAEELKNLAERLQRTRSDAVRYIIVNSTWILDPWIAKRRELQEPDQPAEAAGLLELGDCHVATQ